MEYIVRHQIESTVLNSFFYNPHQQDLIVVFKSGKKYVYRNVPLALIQEFDEAPSYGSFYNKYIKGSFVCEQG